ncbi:hypothetical protein [Jannaschia aquimarina]|uniref:DUF5666 domain-containing protein n=1 Tax=Jannaschia aquimarina TaxID=935700 RepID=A0A0D1CJT3_9RHOB|nr:hypothetical protein [Jannaschia aquimarina]KIT14992.1 hypothetical protein jaqu_33170 [Jannaschia aquimarina]SNS61413.1 hypothetical protein SAMN05421775_101642 [Jannaschia aquimarina]
MKKPDRRHVLCLAAGAGLSACMPAPALVTREDPFEGGIGGTGIVGVLTDFGSLIVNGLRIEIDDRTPVSGPFGRMDVDALGHGQSLTVVADRRGDRLVAQSVRVEHALVGTVADGRVNGVPVRAEAGISGVLVEGARVAVDGAWTRTGVVASRISAASPGPDLIAGVVDQGGIGGTGLRGRAGPSGSYLAAQGRYTNGALTVERARSGRFAPGTALRQLSVEGYLEPVTEAPDWRLAGLGHSFARDLALAPLSPHRALYFGPYDGRFRAATAFVVPEGFERRRTLLRDGPDGRRVAL